MPPTIGGITTYITELFNSNLNKKYELIPFGTERPTFGIVKEVSDYTLIYKIGLLHSLKSIIWTLSHIMKFPFSLLKNRPDIVHINTSSYWSYWENVIYVMISKIFSRKVLLHVHGSQFDIFYNKSNDIFKKLISIGFNASDKIIALSRRWKNFFLNMVSERKIIIIPNFVDSNKYKKYDDFKENSKKIRILFIGGTDFTRKGIYVILKAIPIIIKEDENIKFNFVGKFDNKNFKEIINKNNLNRVIKLLGYIDEKTKVDIMSKSDIYTLPSYSEGLPISILEAMSSGLPIISTKVGGIPEVIEDGINGFLIDPGDYTSLAQKILILIKDKELRYKMSTNNMMKIKNIFDVNIIINKIDNLYNTYLDKY